MLVCLNGPSCSAIAGVATANNAAANTARRAAFLCLWIAQAPLVMYGLLSSAILSNARRFMIGSPFEARTFVRSVRPRPVEKSIAVWRHVHSPCATSVIPRRSPSSFLGWPSGLSCSACTPDHSSEALDLAVFLSTLRTHRFRCAPKTRLSPPCRWFGVPAGRRNTRRSSCAVSGSDAMSTAASACNA